MRNDARDSMVLRADLLNLAAARASTFRQAGLNIEVSVSIIASGRNSRAARRLATCAPLSEAKTKGLTFQVLRDWNYAKAGDPRPRIQEVFAGNPIPDDLAGDPQLKRCVLTRRLHSDSRNVVTMIGGNSGRAMAEVIDRLCKSLAATKLFVEIRSLLRLSDEDALPKEFQCVFVVEFTAQGQEVQNVRAEYCARVPSSKGVVKDASSTPSRSRLG